MYLENEVNGVGAFVCVLLPPPIPSLASVKVPFGENNIENTNFYMIC